MNEVIKHNESGFNFNTKLSISTHKEMILIDIGTRYKLLFVVYGVGYYDSIDDFSKDNIFNSKSSKGLVMQFYRNVSKDLMVSTFESSIKQRNIDNNIEVEKQLVNLNNCFNDIDNLKYKDILHLIWENEILYLYYNNVLIGEIKSNLFAELVFKCYLDKNSVIKDLINK